MFTTEAELNAYLSKRETTKHDRLLLNPSFTATVIGVRGSAGAYEVRVQRPNDSSSGSWYSVQNNGTVPQVGDRIDMRWRDPNLASATAIVGTPPRVTDQHNIKARLYWTGSATLSAGWNLISFNGVSFDPAKMYGGTGFIIPLPGYYLVVVKSGNTAATSTAVGIYTNGVETAVGTWLANTATYYSEAIVMDVCHFDQGDAVQGYIYLVSGGASQLSGATGTYMSIHLLSAD